MYSNRLKQIRQELDLSVAKMAKKLDMSASTLTAYERGDRTPSLDLLSRLYRTFNVSADWFVSGEGKKFKAPQFEEVQDELTQKVEDILRRKGIID